MPSVTLKRLDESARLPERATAGSFGYDIATVEDIVIGPRETTIVPSGLQLGQDLPITNESGLAMLILPRSSLPLKHGLILPNAAFVVR